MAQFRVRTLEKNNIRLTPVRREGFRGAFGPCLKASMEDFTLAVSRSFLLKPYFTVLSA